jgi:hypothetical protein
MFSRSQTELYDYRAFHVFAFLCFIARTACNAAQNWFVQISPPKQPKAERKTKTRAKTEKASTQGVACHKETRATQAASQSMQRSG